MYASGKGWKGKLYTTEGFKNSVTFLRMSFIHGLGSQRRRWRSEGEREPRCGLELRRPRITSRGARRMEGRREERTRLRRRCRLRRRSRTLEDTAAAAAARREFDLHLEKMALGQRRRLTRHLTYMHHTHSRRYRWRCSMQNSMQPPNMLLEVMHYFTRK